MHEDSRIYAHDVLVKQYHALPPILLNIVFEFYTILSIVIHCSQSVIDLAAWKHETILFAVRNNFLENVFLCHNYCIFFYSFLA